MTATLALTVAGWAWVLAGIGLLATVVYFTFTDPPDEPLPQLFVAAGSVSGIGSLVLALRSLGFSASWLWVWRGASVLYVFVALFLLQSSARSTEAYRERTLSRVTALLNLIVALALGAASLIAQQIPIQPSTAVAVRSSAPVLTIDGVRLWHGSALGILAAGTILFLILFIRMVERGVTPQLESHWGGLGGGMSGWRLSASLTYLLAAAVFGVLFAIFVVQLEVDVVEKKPATVARTTPTRPAPTTTAPNQ